MNPEVSALGAIELGVPNLEASIAFYRDVWGLEIVERTGGVCYFRATGPQPYVLALHERAEPDFVRVVLNTRDRAAVDALCARLRASAGVIGEPAAIEAPGGGYGFSFKDLDGREFRIACEAREHSDAHPANDRPYKLSHVVFNSPDFDRAAAFFRDALGFRLRDRTKKANFLGCNTDHHCVAFTDRAGSFLSHVAFELPSLDAVLRGAGRLKGLGMKLEWGVGRHGTGDNVFAYFIDPDGFVIEYTTEMQQVDDASYVPGTPDTIARPAHSDVWGLADPPSARFLEAVKGPKARAIQC